MLPSLKHVLHVSSNGFFLPGRHWLLFRKCMKPERCCTVHYDSQRIVIIYLKSTKISLRAEDSVDIWLRLSLLEPDRSKDLTL